MTDVLVVGAGPSGLFLACDLLRRGLVPRVVDKLAAPSPHSKAIVVHARTLEILEDLGVAGEFLARGTPLTKIRLHADGKVMVQATFDELDTRYPYALSIAQSDTEAILAEHLVRLGGKLERGVELLDFETSGDEVVASLRGAAPSRSAWIVGCDGAHSAVRKRAGLDFEGRLFPQGFWLADVKAAWDLPTDEINTFFHPDGVAACFPMPHERWRLILSAPDGDDLGRSDPPELAAVEALVRERTGRAVTLEDAAWLARFRISTRQTSAYRAGRALLCGDAAHIHSPVGGQGLNTGLQDAHNLAWKLALVQRGRSRPTLLDSYHQERHTLGAALLAATDLATRVGTFRHPVVRAIRNRAASFLSQLEVIQLRLIRSVAELDLNYRKSPIVAERRRSILTARIGLVESAESPSPDAVWAFGAAPRAGDRVPDATAIDAATGAAVRLSEVIDSRRHTLLLFDGRAPTEAGYRHLADLGGQIRTRWDDVVAVHIVVPYAERPAGLHWDGSLLLDPEGELETRFGALSECLYLIRPDLYVGYRSQPASADELVDYLAGLFDGPS